MKKLLFLGSAITSLLTPIRVFAQTTINIQAPATAGFLTIDTAVKNFLTLSFAIAVIIVLIMLIWGAFEWIASGGDKEAVGKARNRIINALIGLAILAIAFALLQVFAGFTGLNLGGLEIPGPRQQ